MKKELLLKGTVITNKGNNYTVVELKEDSVIVEGIKGIKELKLSTITKNFKLVKEVKEEKIVNLRLESIENSYYLESKEEEERLLKEEIEAPIEEIEESKEVEEAKEVEKEIEEPKEESKEEVKEEEKEIITLRDIVEEIVREKLLILDLEYNPNNTFKNIRKKIRKKGNITKSLRLEGYTYSFRIENKNLIKEELLKILA